jgi:hypothetical protein
MATYTHWERARASGIVTGLTLIYKQKFSEITKNIPDATRDLLFETNVLAPDERPDC